MKDKIKNTKIKFNFNLKDLIWLVIIIFLAVLYFTKNDNSDKIKKLEGQIENLKDSIEVKEKLIDKTEDEIDSIYTNIEKKDSIINSLEEKKGKNNNDNEKNRSRILNLNNIDKIKFLSNKIK